MLQDIIFRRAEPNDEDFLFSQYLERRSPELAGLGWGDREVHSFLKMQYEMRRQAYHGRYPKAEYRVIQLGKIAVGQMIVHRTEDLITLVDVSISSEFRGRGIGAGSIRRLQNEAEQAGVPIILHVDRTNFDARKLYIALDFAVTHDTDQVSVEMKWCSAKLT
ncbi:MAG: GNAT family N-acetyltransferase [Pyrinomonadaceae bacterium]